MCIEAAVVKILAGDWYACGLWSTILSCACHWAAVPVFAPLPWLYQYRMQCWTHYKHYSIGTAGTNGYLWESKYHWTTFGHDHRNSLFEGLTIDLTQPFISHWIRPVRGSILIILLYDLSLYPPYPEIPWLSADLMRAREICYLKCEHPKKPTHHRICCTITNAVEKRVCDERRKCERLWSELYKHLKHPTTLSTIKFKGGRDNPL